jgi:outer membrane receptor protein involved in Fe transport
MFRAAQQSGTRKLLQVLAAGFIVLLGICCVPTYSQITNATIIGTIKDNTGAVIPGAQVVVKSLSTATEWRVTSSSGGDFTVANLPPGHYSISYSKEGFRSSVIPDIELLVAQRASFDAQLEVGSINESVTVNTVAPILETSSSEVGQVVNTTTIESIPLNGRSFWQLTSLTPGVTYTPGGQGTNTGGSSIRGNVVAVNINGGPSDQTGWSLDGAFITEMQSGGTMIQPNIDALQEFKVQSGSLPAEYGRTANVVNVSIKSGSNSFHGSGFEFLRNTVLDARNYFYVPPVGSTETRPALRRNQYGGTFGGPIIKNRLFLFADYERTGMLQEVDYSSVVPTAAQHTGDFSALLGLSKPIIITDPLTKLPFSGNIIPASRISSQGNFFAPYMPLPNQLRGTTSYNTVSPPLIQSIQRGDAKVDYQINEVNHIFGRYSINDNNETDPNPFTTLGSFALKSRGQSATTTLIHIWSPNLASEGRVSYYRSIFIFGAALGGTNFNQAASVQGFNDTTSYYSFPLISLSGYASYNGSPYDQRPKSNQHRNLQYALNTTWSTGKHIIKFGADLNHERAGFFNGSSAVGNFAFSGIYSGNAFADMLLGYPDSVTRDYYKQLNGNTGTYWSGFVQDSYRVTDNLTLNYGLRIEHNIFYDGINGQKSALDLTTGKLIIPSNVNPNAQALTPMLLDLFSDRISFTADIHRPNSIQPAEWDFVPRFGFTYQPLRNTVVRGAYGIYQLFTDLGSINNEVATVPFIAAVTVSNDRPPLTPSRTWANFFLGQPNVAANPNPGQPCSFGYAAKTCATPNAQNNELSSRNQYVQQWTAAVQHQFGPAVYLDVTYVGTKTTHLQKLPSINDPAPGAGAIQTRRPYPQWGQLLYNTFSGYANYNALQAKVETTTWHDLTLLGSYSWSKCMDNATGNTSAYQSHSYAVCNYDFPNVFVGSFNYALPFGYKKAFFGNSRMASKFIGGWQAAGVLTMRTGAPFTPTISNDQANTGVGSQWPVMLSKPSIIGKPSCWFYVQSNVGCAAAAPSGQAAFGVPAQYTYGSPVRNKLRSDSLKQLDMTLMKKIAFADKYSMELRFEGFNVLNHPTFAAPTTTINTGSGGQVSSTLNSSRILQVGARLSF